MALIATRRVLKPGTSSVFVGCRGRRTPLSWRLDVREDSRGNRLLFSKRKRSPTGRMRSKLLHYISAGGMRQLRRTSADDIMEDRRRKFLVFTLMMALAWIVFYVLPSM